MQKIALAALLAGDVLGDRADVVAEVLAAGRLDAGEDAHCRRAAAAALAAPQRGSVSQGGSQPVSVGLTFVPGGTISSIRSSTSARERAAPAPELALELLHRARADDRRGDGRVADHERERHLDQRHARPPRRARRARRRPRACAGCRGATCRSARAASARARLVSRATRRPCGSGPTASRRRAGSRGSRPCRTRWQTGSTSASIAADQHRVGRLLADEALAAAPLGDPLRLDDLMGGERRAADVADLAGADEVGRARRASRRCRCRARGGGSGRGRSSRSSAAAGCSRPP